MKVFSSAGLNGLLALFVFMVAGVVASSCLKGKEESVLKLDQSSGEVKVDSVIAGHFAYLDSYLKHDTTESVDLVRLQATVNFMSVVTGIESGVRFATFGAYYVEPVAVQRWKTWIAEHRSSLHWDTVGDSVIVVK